MPLELEVINDSKEVIASVRLDDPVVVGRRPYVNEPMFHLIAQDPAQPQRLVVATERQTTLSKDQAEVTPLGHDRVRLRNAGASGQPLVVRSFPPVRLDSGQEREFAIDPPLVVGLGESSVSLRVS